MAESKVINRPSSANSPPPNCAICLGTFSNKCFSDSCMHEFCFKCLLEWSKIKAECPLCKQPFKRIIHNVKSNEEYDEHIVDIPSNEEIHIIDNEEFLFLPLGGTPQPPTRHHFHFRTTFTVDTRGEHAIQQMLMTHPLTNGGQISVGAYPARANYHRPRRSRENYTTTSFRRSVYRRNLWVNALADVSGRYREVSPSFFRDCPGARTRLVPWLNRELNALLYENTQLVMHLVDIIMDLLLRHHICSRTFRTLLFDYLDNKTDHFIHEFYNFMRSPFDMIGYDRYVTYSERPRSPPYVVTLPDELSDSNDSDVILVGTLAPQEPVVIDLVNDDTDSDEPILVQADDSRPHVPMLPPVQQTITIPEEDNTSDRCSRSRSRSPPMITLQETHRPTALPPKLRFKGSATSSTYGRHHGGGGNAGESSLRDEYGERMRARTKRKRKTLWSRPSRCHQRSTRSSSSSSRSSSSSSTESITSSISSRDSIKAVINNRHKSNRYPNKMICKYRQPRTADDTSDSDVVIEKSLSSDSDVPLSTLRGRKKQKKKIRKTSSHQSIGVVTPASSKSRRDRKAGQEKRSSVSNAGSGVSNGCSSMSTVTSRDLPAEGDYATTVLMNTLPTATVTATSSVAGCSRYSSNAASTAKDANLGEMNGTPLNLVTRKRHHHDHVGDGSTHPNALPSCSTYQTHSLFRSTTPEPPHRRIAKFSSSSEDDYPLKRLVKKEIKEEYTAQSNNRKNNSQSSSSYAAASAATSDASSSRNDPKMSRSNGRLRSILIKKEGSTNTWYSYPRNYSDTSSN